MIERYPRALVAGLLAILLLYVPLYGLYYFGMQTVFGYLAHDAFYYLVVAKNSTFGFFTFDGEKATNGFHPLWQYILTALFGVLRGHGSEVQLYATFLLGAVLTTLGFIFTGWSLYLITRSVYLPVWLVPGPFYLLFTVKVGNRVAHGLTYTYSPWAFMNGMESPCSIAAGGLFLYLLTRACYPTTEVLPECSGTAEIPRPSDWTFLALGISLALLVMARLDDVFLFLTTALFFLFLGRRESKPLRNLFFLVAPTAVLMAGYMAFNYFSCNTFLPISGMVKSSGTAAFAGNLKMSLCDLFPPLSGLIRPSYSLREWGNTTIRSSAMVLPMVFALWLAVHLWRRRIYSPDDFDKFKWLLPVLGYVVLKGMYNFINVRLGSQGYWYYALPVLMTNYLAILFFWRLVPPGTFRRSRILKSACVGLYVFLYLFTSANSISSGSFADYRYYPLWRDRKEITSALKRIDPAAKLIDRSDGAYAYSLDMPAICVLGYAIDYSGYVALKNDKLLDYCLSRGFNITFESPNAYPIQKEPYSFKKIYEHKASGTTFFKIEAPQLTTQSN